MSRIIVTKPLDILVTSTCEIYNYDNIKNYILSLKLVKQMSLKKPSDETKEISIFINGMTYIVIIEYWKIGGEDVLGISVGKEEEKEEEEVYEDCLVIDNFHKLPCKQNEPYIGVDNYLDRNSSNIEDEICKNLIKLPELARCCDKRDRKLNYLEVKYKGKKYQIKYSYETMEYVRYKTKNGNKLVIKKDYKKMEDLELIRIRLYENTTIEKLKSLDSTPEQPVSKLIKYADAVEKFKRDFKLAISKSQI